MRRALAPAAAAGFGFAPRSRRLPRGAAADAANADLPPLYPGRAPRPALPRPAPPRRPSHPPSARAEEADDDEQQEVPLLNVKSVTLGNVIEFCRHHQEEPMDDIEKPLKSSEMREVVQDWYANFVNVEQDVLFDLILAANYMDIKPLLDLTCATIASMIKGKTPEEIRRCFNILNDFSPEEEAQVREENKWCEEA